MRVKSWQRRRANLSTNRRRCQQIFGGRGQNGRLQVARAMCQVSSARFQASGLGSADNQTRYLKLYECGGKAVEGYRSPRRWRVHRWLPSCAKRLGLRQSAGAWPRAYHPPSTCYSLNRSVFKFQVSGLFFRSGGSFPVAGCRLKVAGCKSHVPGAKFQVSGLSLILASRRRAN